MTLFLSRTYATKIWSRPCFCLGPTQPKSDRDLVSVSLSLPTANMLFFTCNLINDGAQMVSKVKGARLQRSHLNALLIRHYPSLGRDNSTHIQKGGFFFNIQLFTMSLGVNNRQKEM